MGRIHYCLRPCHRYFDNARALQIHRGHKPDCAARWEANMQNTFRKRRLQQAQLLLEIQPAEEGKSLPTKTTQRASSDT